jgi:Undecaprenyl-phosphate glucose phosphotransferase
MSATHSPPAVSIAASPEVLDPLRHANPGGPIGRNRLTLLLASLFTDKRHNVSRPKLLIAVTLADVVMTIATGLVAAHLTAQIDAPHLMRTVLMAAAVSFALRGLWGYSIASLRDVRGQIGKIVLSVMLAMLVFAGLDHLVLAAPIARPTMLAWAAALMPALLAMRVLVWRGIGMLERSGRLTRRTVIVGGGKDADELIAALSADNAGLQILGIFDDRADGREAVSAGGLAVLGTFEDLTKFCRDAGVDLLVVTVPQSAEYRLLQILKRLFTVPVDIRISALNARVRLNPKAYAYIGKVPMLPVMDKPLSDWDRAIKNIEDRVLGALLLIAVLPVMAAVALAVRLDSRGPILFRQRRYGFNNELIDVYKFRSMRVDMLDATAAKLVTRDDPRVTRVGRFIRRTSLDELPQLFNVIKGEMSLVGPRPHATQAKADSDLYHHVVQGYFARHRMKPGVTGWAQVNGWRGETDTHEKLERRVEHDIEYIDNWSVLFDLWILVLTPLSMIRGKNAY